LSPRAAGPFVAINCAAIPESLMESELFGHEKGAFTNAVARRGGCFEHANQGTLFLDEIGEMPLQMQAKLLRVLEDSKVRRLGGDREISVDVRIVAATNRPIQEALGKNLLREDLYYRLNVFHLDLPPLRHRKEDIAALAEALIRNLNQKNDCRVTDLHPEAHARLMNYAWPGNVRELRNVLERAVIVAREGTLLSKHLPPGFGVPEMEKSSSPTPVSHGSITLQPGMSLGEVDKAYIKLTLERTKNKKEAARILGISLRTLQSRISEILAEESAQSSRGSAQTACTP
jgi:transcriptional regulator with PAS, ATPase and Fis domain